MSQGNFPSIAAAGLAGSTVAQRTGAETAEISARTTALAQMKESQKRAQAATEAGSVENEAQKTFQDKEGDGSWRPGQADSSDQRGRGKGQGQSSPAEKDPFGQVGGSLDITA
ncbi:MAG: hypothetical protein Q4G68_05710 [Planctomycetia bacterium]|nr:hypothetical protein [Planctomycetia bacterium]